MYQIMNIIYYKRIAKRTVAEIIAALCILFLSSAFNCVTAYQTGNYPELAYAKLFSDGTNVSDKPNSVLNAIENGNAIPLKFGAEFKAMQELIFPQQYYGERYIQKKLNSAKFIETLAEVVKEFSCAEYRFRHQLPEKSNCNGYIVNNRKKEHMPFVSGRYMTNRIEANRDDHRNRISFQAYLESSKEKSLESAFGSVHELGSFFGRLADRRSLVLSVQVQTFWLNTNQQREKPMLSEPLTYFLILPKAVDIAQQKSESAAASYALANTRLLILGK
jgi:hypothetical protein